MESSPAAPVNVMEADFNDIVDSAVPQNNLWPNT